MCSNKRNQQKKDACLDGVVKIARWMGVTLLEEKKGIFEMNYGIAAKFFCDIYIQKDKE